MLLTLVVVALAMGIPQAVHPGKMLVFSVNELLVRI